MKILNLIQENEKLNENNLLALLYCVEQFNELLDNNNRIEPIDIFVLKDRLKVKYKLTDKQAFEIVEFTINVSHKYNDGNINIY